MIYLWMFPDRVGIGWKLLAAWYKFRVWTQFITRNMGQDGDGHAHFDPIWRPNITINYMGVDQNIKF